MPAPRGLGDAGLIRFLQGGSNEAMARLEFLAKWRAIASLDPALRFSQIQ